MGEIRLDRTTLFREHLAMTIQDDKDELIDLLVQESKQLDAIGLAGNDAIPLAIARLKSPEIVCLCGSTRFSDAFLNANLHLTLKGKIVLSIGCATTSDSDLGITAEQKIALDELHKRKIDLCDSVLVLNVGGYIGESTRSEIEYAEKIGRPVRYLEE